mgnify:CR=1 FL=1
MHFFIHSFTSLSSSAAAPKTSKTTVGSIHPFASKSSGPISSEEFLPDSPIFGAVITGVVVSSQGDSHRVVFTPSDTRKFEGFGKLLSLNRETCG